MNLADIQKGVSALSPEDLTVFRNWFVDYFKAGRAAGRLKNLPVRRGATMRLAAPWSFKHRPTARYWECYGDLPAEIRVLADKCIGQLNENPDHPSLRFRKNGLIWSINVGPDHKALAIETSSGYLWFWIGLRGRVDSAKDRR